MQNELDALLDANDLPIEIIGVNEPGHESANDQMCAGRELAWLQDTVDQRVWAVRWAPYFRDVVILDEQNRFLGSFNLSSHDLGNPTHYATLKERLLAHARR